MTLKIIETITCLLIGIFVGIFLTNKYYIQIVKKLKDTIHYNNKGIEIRENKIKGYKEELKHLEELNHQLMTNENNEIRNN